MLPFSVPPPSGASPWLVMLPVAVTEDTTTRYSFGLWRALRWLSLALVLIFFLAPIAYLALVSLKPQPEVLSGQLLPSRIAWEKLPHASTPLRPMLISGGRP